MSKKDKKNMDAKEYRASLYVPKEEKKDHRDLFRRLFLKLKKKHNLKANMEEVLWLHLVAVGCDVEDKFNEGILNFGLK